MAKVSVTGASGFLGSRVVAALARRGHSVRAVSRAGSMMPGADEALAIGDLLESDLTRVVAGADIIVNCAARVHVLPDGHANADDRMNHRFAVALAHAAKTANVTRFIQISSVAAITSQTKPGEIVSDRTEPRPGTPYGRSKLDADNALATLCEPGFTTVSLRPPVIVGPGAAAWFGMLNRAARLGMPLPVGRIENSRSFVFVENVADAVATAVESDLAGAYIVTDSDPISTGALYRRLLALHGRPNRVWHWPATVMRTVARVGLRERAASLLGDAAYDGSRFRDRFAWTPPVSFESGLEITAGSRKST
ncbi:MAG TPA: NAD-dependent epimerase/dehydratase family protein [Qipengyuania sp.]|nr:NAD-dependent epimerase/dehydratase family protein [Qipengyuania sp.]